jgi:hypothetical protein
MTMKWREESETISGSVLMWRVGMNAASCLLGTGLPNGRVEGMGDVIGNAGWAVGVRVPVLDAYTSLLSNSKLV